MAPEDREHTFEKALTRRLRAGSSAAAGKIPQPSCPDAEILAAYHDRDLSPDEMALWRQHISACPRCQEILAYLDGTDAVPVHDARKDANLAPESLQTPVLQISKSGRARRWLWTAPAGAIAAGLLVWIVVQQKPRHIEVAKNEQPPISLSPTVPRSEVATAPGQPALHGDREKVSSALASRSADSAVRQNGKPFATATSPRIPSAKALRKDQRDDNKLDVFDSRRSSSIEPQPAPGAISDQVKKLDTQSAKAPMPALPAMSQTVTVNAEAAPVAAPPPPPAAPQALAKAKAGISAPELQSKKAQQVQEIGGMSRSRFNDAPSLLLANSKSPATVTTPNSKVSWRVGHAGSIERSEDGESTWSVQPSGVLNDLVAGSAPSDKICWVVGRLGTILRTTDGGAAWTKLHSPIADDILSVFAVSAQQATVFTAHGSYQTLDGGATWNKLAPE